MTPSAGAPLAGLGVLVTRPLEQAGGLLQGLQALGAHAIAFPTLAILPPEDPAALHAVLGGLPDCDLAIFISPSAARAGVEAVRAALGAWPAGPALAAVGAGTARALAELGLKDVIHPAEGADSEHLLAHLDGLPAWRDLTGRRVLILRGEEGRETLADGLRARGADVRYAACYRRGLPPGADPAPILAAFAAGQIQAVTAYSRETLDNLFTLLSEAGTAALADTPLFVPHARIAEHARTRGVRTVLACPGGDAQLIAGLVKYFRHE